LTTRAEDSHNRRLAELLQVSQEVLDQQRLLQHMADTSKIRNSSSPKSGTWCESANGRDEIEFTDGMILDRYSAPVVGKDGKHYGRIWTFGTSPSAKSGGGRAESQRLLLAR